MIELSKELKKFIRCIPQNILSELWDITQDFNYEYNEDGSTKWRYIDALTQEISYASREGNNPEDVKIIYLGYLNDKPIIKELNLGYNIK